MHSFQKIVQFLVSGSDPITNINEVATVMSVAPATVYGYRNQGTEPKFSQIIALNRFLVDQKDCYIIEKVFCSTKGEGGLHSNIQTIREELAILEYHIKS